MLMSRDQNAGRSHKLFCMGVKLGRLH